MTDQDHRSPRRAERLMLLLAVAALLGSAILAWRSPDALVASWRLAVFVCLQPALGSLIFILIHRLTGGQWGRGLAPYLLSGARLLPWVWLLALPLLWYPIAAQPYRPASSEEQIHPLVTHPVSDTTDAITALEHAFAPQPSRHFGPTVRTYFSRPLVVTRSVLYGLVFLLLALGARRALRPHPAERMRWFGPLGLIGLVLILHLLVTDWIMLLDPGWHSTGFPLVWMAGQAVAGLATATCAALWFGADPRDRGETGQPRGIDWGNLLLASVMSWAYVAFVQLLIIWSGNLPSETSWYRHRLHGAWQWLVIALAALEFGAPFALLLSRRLKRSRGALAAIAALLVLGQLGYTVWMIVPAFPRAAASGPWLFVTLTAAGAALFTNRYLAGARAATVALAR